MKPLAAYAPAIDTGLLMPGSIIIDEPVTYGGWISQKLGRQIYRAYHSASGYLAFHERAGS